MGAVFSPCGRYRYLLEREFLLPGPTIAFGLHNPSTAGVSNEDATSRRGIGYWRSWGAGKGIFVNPWAGIATKPEDLWQMDDPVGPENDAHIARAAVEVRDTGGFFVLAWGAVAPPRQMRSAVTARLRDFEALIRDHGCDIRALGVTKDGSPRHPLYLRADAHPVPWVGRAASDAADGYPLMPDGSRMPVFEPSDQSYKAQEGRSDG